MSRLIDYRRTYWGHSFETWEDYGHGRYKISAFSKLGLKIGDVVRWKTGYGYADFTIYELRQERDPMDMYWLKVQVTTRYNANGEVIG